jgi:serine/threonine protein kinase
MDWMDGGTLLDLLLASPNRRLDYFLAARIISDVAAGLHAAHELTGPDGCPLNVVHRDVSPQNVLLSSAGHVKVADFGVAKARGQLHTPTVTGELKGKLSYMAPEQLTSKFVDRRADVFALGCCLYEATTGTRPYHGADALETMYKLLETECEAPSKLLEDYPSELELIVLRALEKDPEKRYQNADDVRVALAGFLARNGKLITDREISALVRTVLADPIGRRSQALEEATKSIGRVRAETAPGQESTRSKAGHSGHTPHTWNTQPPKASSRHTSRWMLLAAALLGSILVIAFYARPHRQLPVAGSSVALPSTPLPSAPQVTVSIRSEPANATLRIDNGPALTSPQVVITARSEELHGIVASLEGYEPLVRQIAFDRSQELVLGLKPVAPPAQQSAQVSRRQPKRVLTQMPSGSMSSGSADAQINKKKKPKRPIDSANPFADP